MADELTDAAKAEIAAAIAIVREDRFEKFARDRLGKLSESKPTETPPTPPTNNPPTVPTGNPPPPTEPSQPPTEPSNVGKKSIWWGDRLDSGD